ncbi:hypothetical protein ACVWY3_007027 [Bradyrhizobium sp. USDA 4486]
MALMTKVHESAITIESGEVSSRAMNGIQSAPGTFFCSRCGIYTFHRKRAAPDHFGVNVFCLEDFNPAAVPVRATDGIGMSVVGP